jgi:restriction system protein
MVGRPEIQGFAGALHGAQANRRVFITTSNFTNEAITYADRVVLIESITLAQLMVTHNIGVQDGHSDSSTCRPGLMAGPDGTDS